MYTKKTRAHIKEYPKTTTNLPVLTAKYALHQHATQYQDVEDRKVNLHYNVLRIVPDRIPIIAAIINLRCDQARPFATPVSIDSKNQGFVIRRKGQKSKQYSPEDHQVIEKLQNFVLNTGSVDDPDRSDTFSDWLQKTVREVLTIDQVATELQYNIYGEVCAFWAIDGATIRKTLDYRWGSETERYTDYYKRGVKYIQEIDNLITAEYRHQDLVLDSMNKRSDLRYASYGYSYVEQCVPTIESLVYALEYNRAQFMYNRTPRGFVSMEGVDQQTVTTIQTYWNNAMSGLGGQWKLPIIGTDVNSPGQNLKWNPINMSNKDMEYHKYLHTLFTLVAGVFGVDLAELGIKTETSQTLIGENVKPKIEYSKDRGLKTLLSFIEGYINKILSHVTDEFELHFIGLEPEDEDHKMEIITKQLSTCKSINDVRDELDMKPAEIMFNGVNLCDIVAVTNGVIGSLIQSDAQMSMAQEERTMLSGGDLDGGFTSGDPNENQESPEKIQARMSATPPQEEPIGQKQLNSSFGLSNKKNIPKDKLHKSTEEDDKMIIHISIKE